MMLSSNCRALQGSPRPPKLHHHLQGYPLAEAISHCKAAVDSGYWPLYRYNPLLAESGNNPFQLDSKKITGDLFKFLANENRYAVYGCMHPFTEDRRRPFPVTRRDV